MATEISWEDLERLLQGCTLLIGLTFTDKDGQVLEQYQTHGVFESFTADRLMQIRREDSSLFQLPYDPEAIVEAPPGDYRERSTGIVITDPDYLVRWEITVKDQQHLEATKQHGFIPAMS